jgi:hypothetical protein
VSFHRVRVNEAATNTWKNEGIWGRVWAVYVAGMSGSRTDGQCEWPVQAQMKLFKLQLVNSRRICKTALCRMQQQVHRQCV